MAWDLMGGVESLEGAWLNLLDLPLNDLREIYVEWKANGGGDESYNEQVYDESLLLAQSMTSREMATGIWLIAGDRGRCNDRGDEAWICPFGCHTVAFDRDPRKDR